jgi:hypothetical protein
LEEDRHIEKLVSVFDLALVAKMGLQENTPIRVMLIYDQKNNKKEFTLLNKRITPDQNQTILAWLEENIDIKDMN